MSSTKSCRLENIVYYLIGFILVLSSTLKSINIRSFSQEIQQYINMYLADILLIWSQEIAVVVCALELLVGILALAGRYKMLASVTFVVIFSFFLYITGLNVFFPSEYFGSIESCGCFGELIHFTPMASFIKSVVLWLMSFILIMMNMSKNSLLDIWKELKEMIRDSRTYILMVSSCLPSWFSVNYLEKMGHEQYIVIYVAICMLVLACSAMMYSSLPSEK